MSYLKHLAGWVIVSVIVALIYGVGWTVYKLLLALYGFSATTFWVILALLILAGLSWASSED